MNEEERPKWKVVNVGGGAYLLSSLPDMIERHTEEGYEFVCIVPCNEAVFLYRRIEK